MTAVLERTEVSRPVNSGPWLLGGVALLVLSAAAVTALYRTAPEANEGSGPVDALLVLGTPADMDGSLTRMQRWRVDEAVREYNAGRASRILFSGGPTANRFVESAVMAGYARELGVPAGAILTEERSHTTVQNVSNSVALMQAHGWRSVEVISTPEHLPRAAVILEKTPILWRVHPAPTPGRSRSETMGAFGEEAVGTAVLRVFGTRAEPVLHVLAVTQHGLAWGVRWVIYKVEAWVEAVHASRGSHG